MSVQNFNTVFSVGPLVVSEY